MLGSPAPTAYDLKFRLLGTPVRVHPFFWVFSVLMGMNRRDPIDILIWVVAVFVSILVHEFGHALMSRLFGHRSSVVLYSMGGLCVPEDGQPSSPWKNIAILLAGPGAGFVLFGLLLGGYLLAGSPTPNPPARILLNDLLFINLFWGLANLLPIWPLDGGQIAGIILTMFSPYHGARRGHIVSLVTAAAAIVLVVKYLNSDQYLIILLIFLGIANYQMLQAHHDKYVSSGYDDADYWKR